MTDTHTHPDAERHNTFTRQAAVKVITEIISKKSKVEVMVAASC